MIKDKFDKISKEDKKVVIEFFLNKFIKRIYNEDKLKDYPKTLISKLRVIGLFTSTMIKLDLDNKNFSKEFLRSIEN